MSRQIEDIIFDLRYGMPTWPSTFSQCANDCGRMARGGNQCTHCLTEELATFTGKPLESNRLVRAMAEVQQLTIALREATKEGEK